MNMTVFKNWDKEEREIERKSHKEYAVPEHDQEDPLDELDPDEKFDAKYVNVRFSMLEKQHAHKIDYLTTYIRHMSEFQARQEEEIRGLREEIRELHEEYERAHLEDLFERSDASREDLDAIFGTDPSDMEDVSLDGLLEDYVDPEQNSQELVRFIRDN